MRAARLVNHQRFFKKYEKRRNFFKKVLMHNCSSIEFHPPKSPLTLANYLSFFPRFSGLSRNKSLCFLTSKPRSVIGKFKLARIALRELVHFVKVQGVQRSTW